MVRKLYILVFALLALSCNRIDQPEQFDGHFIDVPFEVLVDAVEVVTKGEGESVGEEEQDGTVDGVVNLKVIQYEYNEGRNDYVLKGRPIDIEDFNEFITFGEKSLKLIASDQPCVLIFLGNIYDEFEIADNSTLIEMMQRSKPASSSNPSSNDFLSTYGDERYPIFNSYVSLPEGINEDTSIKAELKRNLAKVNITVQKGDDCGVTIDSVKFCSVSKESYFVTNYESLTSPFPTIDNHATIDYASILWEDGKTSMTISDEWLPVNMRGTTPENVSPAYKNLHAPEGATYLLVSGTYKDENGQVVPVSYKFYLGANMVDDFNIEPNHAYSYTFTIDKKGDAANDSRVEDMGLVDFTSTRYELANSYVLNPPTTGTRRFRIPIQRLFTFWGDEIYDYYEQDETLALKNNEGKWRAFVLQSEFLGNNSEGFNIKVDRGTAGTGDYFEVEVKSGVKGNVVIGVGPYYEDGEEDERQVSWSWHLWITDYDPYDALDWGDGRDGKYIYPVTGGAVHRYEGTYWNNNKDCYIMDRNLGWLSDPYVYPGANKDKQQDDNKGLLYYQYGRKDPFFYASKQNSVTSEGANTAEHNGVWYSVRNPGVFIISASKESWTVGNQYNPSEYDKNIIWNDPATVQGQRREGKKSIFDPCPPGFRLPDKSIWSDFRDHTQDNRTTNSYPYGTFPDGYVFPDTGYDANFKSYNSIKGMQYWPYQGEGKKIPDFHETIYIPATGCFRAEDAGIYHPAIYYKEYIAGTREMWSFLWSENPESSAQGRGYTSQYDHLAANNAVSRARAFPVRCVTYK